MRFSWDADVDIVPPIYMADKDRSQHWKKLIYSLGNVEEMFYDHLILNWLVIFELLGEGKGKTVTIALPLMIWIWQS